MSTLPRLAAVVVQLSALGCAASGGSPANVATSAMSEDEAALLGPVDGTVDPCTNFVEFACGRDREPSGQLHADIAAGADANERRKTRDRFLARVLAGEYQDRRYGANLARDFYLRCRDVAAREEGMAELRQRLGEIDDVQSLDELVGLLAKPRVAEFVDFVIPAARWFPIEGDRLTSGVFFLGGPTFDNQAHVTESPDIVAWREHLLRLANLVGVVSPADIDGAIRVDRVRATWSSPNTPALDPVPPPLRRRVLDKSRFPWATYLGALGVSVAAPLRGDRNLIPALNALAALPLADLKAAAKVQMMTRTNQLVSLEVLEEALGVQPESPSKETFDLAHHCVGLAKTFWNFWDFSFEESYLRSLGPPVESETAHMLFALLRDRLADRVERADWLDELTRRTTAEKVRHIVLRFEEFDRPANMERDFAPGSLLAAATEHYTARYSAQVAKIGRVGQRLLYPWYQAQGNYSGVSNGVWLQRDFAAPPFIRHHRLDAIALGTSGVLMGHELAHALSPHFRGADENVDLQAWPKDALVAYDGRAACLQQAYDDRDAGMPWAVDNPQTLNEDVADVTGLQIAVATLDDLPLSDKDDIQRRRRNFFVAYAQSACTLARGHLDSAGDAEHSATGRELRNALAQLPEFASTFRCTPGKPMAPRQRCPIWVPPREPPPIGFDSW